MRSLLIVASTALAIAVPAAAVADHHGGAPAAKLDSALTTAVAASTRTPANVARDKYRNPAETLSFFGVKPGDTVVELFPGGGWYTEILAPFSKAGGGTYFAVGPWDRGLTRVKEWQAANPAVYGDVKLAEFPNAGTNPKVADGSADVVLTFRNVHNLRFSGVDTTADAFKQMFAMLKPGGVLGVVEHRLPETMDSALEEKSGYMKRSSVVAFAEAAGFKLAGESAINANPNDTHDYPKGVWTLPPALREGEVDRDKYLAIGESDRMTLKFVKPAA